MENWLDKYKPKKISKVLGDKFQIRFLNFFIKKFVKEKPDISKIYNPNVIITGMNGIGKTLIVDLILQENGFEKIVPDLSSIYVAKKNKRKNSTGKESINPNRSVITYYKMLVNNKNLLSDGSYRRSKVAIVFDDVTNISNPKEKEAIKSIIKLNNKHKQIPIFIIGNTKHSKIINDLRKMVTYSVRNTMEDGKKNNKKIINEVKLNVPNVNDIIMFIDKICAEEDLRLIKRRTDEKDLHIQIIEHSQYDIRRLVNILEELKCIYKDGNVSMEELNLYCETSKKKDLDPGIYEATQSLLNEYVNMGTSLSLYGEERATIPLMVHENYPQNINKQYHKMSVEKQLDMMCNISKSISESDKVDGLIYSNQCWSLQSVHGFYSCVMPSHYINKAPNKASNREIYKYTQDYNKTSIKKINNKVIKKAREHQFLKKVSIYDFLYMASILKTLLQRKDFVLIANLMKPYGLELKEIESIIKIDKIKKSKNTLTTKQRNILETLLKN